MRNRLDLPNSVLPKSFRTLSLSCWVLVLLILAGCGPTGAQKTELNQCFGQIHIANIAIGLQWETDTTNLMVTQAVAQVVKDRGLPYISCPVHKIPYAIN